MQVNVEQFTETGYLGPIRVLSKGDCLRFLRIVDLRPHIALDWSKGLAAGTRVYYEIGTHPAILDVVSELLDGEVILWGASIQRRVPEQVHPWHSDIESSDPDSRTVSAWIGLEETTPESSLVVISRSHRLGLTVQQARHEKRRGRDETGLDELLAWARERDDRSELVKLGATDGEAVFFDGRLWHGTHNVARRTRRALLLQYAAPDTPIRIPDMNFLDWPFRQLDRPRPPCLIVRGSTKDGPNRNVPAPVVDGQLAHEVRLTSRIYPLRLPLAPDDQQAWKPFPAFSGSTADLPSVSCHASVLLPGHSPHPPHTHDSEELLVLLSGEVEIVIQGGQWRLRPGEFAYYPAHFAHTLQTVSQDPAMYVMFKWRGDSAPDAEPLSFGRFQTKNGSGLLFEGATRYLRKLHSHVSVREPGSGYEPHVDAYDVGIVMLEGEIETIGGRVVPHDVVFYPAGEAHGLRNVGQGVARYVVFEFHGRTSLAAGAPSLIGALLQELRHPRRHWKRRAKRILRR